MTNDEQRAILEEVLEKMDECARLLRSLRDKRIDAYCLAAFEGKDGGWLGYFERDHVQAALDALDDDECDCTEEDERLGRCEHES
jgi:hypothetical protein